MPSQELTNQLKKEYKYFNERKEDFDEYEDLHEEIDELQDKSSPGIVWASLLFGFVILVVALWIWLLIKNPHTSQAAIALLLSISINAGILFFVAIGVLINSLKNRNTNNKRIRKLKKRCLAIESGLEKYYKRYEGGIVPITFSNPEVIKMLIAVSKHEEYKSIDEIIDALFHERRKSYKKMKNELAEMGIGEFDALFVSPEFFR